MMAFKNLTIVNTELEGDTQPLREVAKQPILIITILTTTTGFY